jgi:hypothetical protein
LRNVSRATDELVVVVSQIHTTSAELARCASDRASALEEVAASLTEIEGTSGRNARDASATRDKTRSLQAQSERSVARMQQLAATMQEMEASASQRACIVKTIDEIAFQTNLLAQQVGQFTLGDEARSAARARVEQAFDIMPSPSGSTHAAAGASGRARRGSALGCPVSGVHR